MMKTKINVPWSSVIIFALILSLTSINLVKKIKWYQFCQRFSLYGAVTKLEKPLIAGVDQIIRGEEAEKVILGISKDLPVIGEDMDFVVFRIKVQNPSKKVVDPLGIRIEVFEKSDLGEDQSLVQMNMDLTEDSDLTFKSDYKKFNTNSPYEAGETKYGTYILATKKGSTLTKYKVLWEQPYVLEKSESANLSHSKFQLLDYLDYAYLYFFVLFLLVILFTYIQRKRKRSDGFAKSLMIPYVLRLFFFSGVCFMILEDAWVPFLYLKILIVLVLPTIIYYFYIKHRYVILFSFVNEKDASYIQEEFVKRMEWTHVGIEKCKDHVEVTNKDTWETYHFYLDYVKKEDVKDSLAKAKEILQEIYLSLPIDRTQVVGAVLDAFGFIVFMILIL